MTAVASSSASFQGYHPTIDRQAQRSKVSEMATGHSHDLGAQQHGGNLSSPRLARGGTSPTSPRAQHANVPYDEEELPEPICGGCKKLIDEESADAGVIHFATQLWHVDCFRCAKCRNPVTTDRDDILLLSDGHPICGQCNYSCQICNQPIMEEAIMTGEESYHASCFVCRSCRTPIAELVFAKTSQGIYCMKCHNQRVARSRRHAEKKRQAAAAAASAAAAAGASTDLQSTAQHEGRGTEHVESIPAPPTVIESTPNLDSTPFSPPVDAQWQQQKLQGDAAETGVFSTSPKGGPLQPIQPSSHLRQGSARRPMNPPPPTSLRSLREGIARPSTSESSNNEFGARATSSRSSPNAFNQWNNDSPLFAGAQAAAKQQSSTPKSPRALASPRSSEDVTASPSFGEATRNVPERSKSDGRSRDASFSDIERQTPGTYESGRLESPERKAGQVPRPVSKDVSGTFSPQQASGSNSSGLLALQQARANHGRLSKSYSFYDPDIVNLMESFGHLGSSDDTSFDGVASRAGKVHEDDTVRARTSSESIPQSRRGMDETSRPVLDFDAETPSSARESSESTDKKENLEDDGAGIPRSASMAERMRQSLLAARSDGKIKLDKAMLQGMLEEFDVTHQRMKELRKKYDRIRRASQQAAQGFSSAREEYEQEVRARYDAEAELLTLKREVHLQASQLAELTSERKQHENMHKQTQEIKNSIQGLEKELSKLRIERDLHAAEIAELTAAQNARSGSGSTSEENIKRNLVSRMESVKEKFRNEIGDLLADRDTLLSEIEELRQAREASAEEAKTMNARNEELSAILNHLQQRLEHAQAAEKFIELRAAQNGAGLSAGSVRAPANNFGFNLNKTKPGSIASTATAVENSSQVNLADPQEGIGYAAPVPIGKADAAPRKFKWMKGTKLMTGEAAKAVLQNGRSALAAPALPPKGALQQIPGVTMRDSPGGNHTVNIEKQQSRTEASARAPHGNDWSSANANGNAAHGEIVIKEHLFQPFNILRPIRCFACQKNMWGQSELRCQFCNQACHVKCLHSLPTSCNQPYTRNEDNIEPTGPSMFGRRLSEQVHSEERSIPLIVERCVETVEKSGMDYEGIYRKSGGTSQLKIITQLFEKGQPFDLGNQDRFNDISAVTSVLKNYFRELPEPLLTFELYESFIECAENKSLDTNTKRTQIHKLLHDLPKEHFDTLRFLIEHLHRIAERSEENRMGSRNLGVVFGPTLMRSDDPSQEFAHMGGKAMTIELMIDNYDLFD